MLDPALLAAILAEPDDDGPRLVLSDWLEEHGEAERAELIRVQCRIAELAAGPYGGLHGGDNRSCGCEPCVLRRRERELLERLSWQQATPYSSATGSGPHHTVCPGFRLRPEQVIFRRGFIHAVTCTAADWLTHADAILAAQPVREVALTTWPEVERAPLGSRTYYRLRRLQEWRPGPAYDGRTDRLAHLAVAWPGIAFTLPEPVTSPGG